MLWAVDGDEEDAGGRVAEDIGGRGRWRWMGGGHCGWWWWWWIARRRRRMVWCSVDSDDGMEGAGEFRWRLIGKGVVMDLLV